MSANSSSKAVAAKASSKRARQRGEELSQRTSSASAGLSHEEKGEVEQKRPPKPAVLHEAIRREGEYELRRMLAALPRALIAPGNR